jgi:AhpD family alkylhydroperoxidase
MESKINLLEHGQNALKTLYPIGVYLAKSPLGKSLLDLVYFRVSQINGCAFCVDMHSKDLRAEGETEQRLYSLDAWREAPFYTERERAALGWAETVTKITNGNISNEVYETARKEFSEAFPFGVGRYCCFLLVGFPGKIISISFFLLRIHIVISKCRNVF